MRIKKVSQTTPTQSQIVDGYSESTTDGYSCNYVNGLHGEILWENPNPTSSISQQNITVNSSDYDILECFYISGTDNLNRMKSQSIIVGKDFFLEFIDTGTNNLITYTRSITYVSSSEYKIRDSYKRATSSVNMDDNYCIPLYIIGYKTGLFD